MDWEDKFTSIVKETELNLAKAKEKLSSKAQTPSSISFQDTLKSQIKGVSQPVLKRKPLYSYNIDDRKSDTLFDNMNASSIQIIHMQEQIDSQNRTIEKLKHLVKSLDGERGYYKEQITRLKGEVDLLTSTMRGQSSLVSSDLKISNVKREVMREMEKVKSMVKTFEKNSARHTPGPSPRFDPEFWNIKENLTTNLEQVRLELSQMKGRIDRMEGQIAIDNMSRMKHDSNMNSFQKAHYEAREPFFNKPLYSSTSKVVPSVTESDLHHLRLTISSINSKLDNIERKKHRENTVIDDGNLRPFRFSTSTVSHNFSRYSKPSDNLFQDDDLHSLSDPSELSNISENNFEDSDDDIDLLGFTLEEHTRPTLKTSGLKESYVHKGRVEFDLSDLELSDVEDVVGPDLETDSIDFEDLT